MLELDELMEIKKRGEGVICRRFAHEAPLAFARVVEFYPCADKHGNLDYSVVCEDRAGCRVHVYARWLERASIDDKEGRSA